MSNSIYSLLHCNTDLHGELFLCGFLNRLTVIVFSLHGLFFGFLELELELELEQKYSSS
jgi:hypothetical protein